MALVVVGLDGWLRLQSAQQAGKVELMPGTVKPVSALAGLRKTESGAKEYAPPPQSNDCLSYLVWIWACPEYPSTKLR